VKSIRPLSDVRLVECAEPGCPLAVRLALAFAGRVACDLGAEVTVVQTAADPVDDIIPLVEGRSALSRFLHAGKQRRSLPPESRTNAAFAEIFSSADAVLSDVGTYERHGVRALQTIWSIVSLRGTMDDGSVQSEFTLMAAGGLLDLVGEPDRSPLRLGGHQLAYSAGLALYSGVAAALCARESGGVPDAVRVNLADVAVWLNWKMVAMASWTNASISRRGNDSEWRTLRCADGWVALVYLEADWPVLRDVIADPRLREPRFDDRAERRRNASYINPIIEQAFSRMTRAQLRDLALEKRLPLGPVWSPIELESDPQNMAREFLNRVPLGSGQGLLLPRLPVIWNDSAAGAA
jgi:CoA-transferase family III